MLTGRAAAARAAAQPHPADLAGRGWNCAFRLLLAAWLDKPDICQSLLVTVLHDFVDTNCDSLDHAVCCGVLELCCNFSTDQLPRPASVPNTGRQSRPAGGRQGQRAANSSEHHQSKACLIFSCTQGLCRCSRASRAPVAAASGAPLAGHRLSTTRPVGVDLTSRPGAHKQRT